MSLINHSAILLCFRWSFPIFIFYYRLGWVVRLYTPNCAEPTTSLGGGHGNNFPRFVISPTFYRYQTLVICWILFILTDVLSPQLVAKLISSKDVIIVLKRGPHSLPPLFVAALMTSSYGNIFRVTGPLCGEFTGHRWIPLTKANDAKLWCFLWSAPE